MKRVLGRAEWTGTVREPDGADYTLGLRLRLDGPPIESGQSLSLWSNQFFDLLLGELTNADFTILTSGQQPIGPLRLVAERATSEVTKLYEITRLGQQLR